MEYYETQSTNVSNIAFDRARTCDLRVNSALLLPTELQKHNIGLTGI